MNRIQAGQLRGVWAALTLPWDEHDQLDESAYRANIRRMCDAGVHGIYTTGSTGEFYALDWDEFRRMVDIQAELCGQHRMPLQIGCCADSTRKTLRLIEYAAGKPEVGAVQFTLPYWMELSDREIAEFFHEIYRSFPDMPLVHYNATRAKRFLLGPDYVRLLDVAPTLIGVKFTSAGTNFASLQSAISMTPDIAYFVAENLVVSAMMLGARGSYSSLVTANPRFMLAMYDEAVNENWTEALRLQKYAAKFFDSAIPWISARGEGTIDPVFDKGLAVTAGRFSGSQRTRPPYIGWSDDTVAAFRDWIENHFPKLLFGAEPRAAGTELAATA